MTFRTFIVTSITVALLLIGATFARQQASIESFDTLKANKHQSSFNVCTEGDERHDHAFELISANQKLTDAGRVEQFQLVNAVQPRYDCQTYADARDAGQRPTPEPLLPQQR